MKRYLLVGLFAATLCMVAMACNNKQDMSTRTWVANVTGLCNFNFSPKLA